jgi:uncharacterized protein involved in outer membrane biogenesis
MGVRSFLKAHSVVRRLLVASAVALVLYTVAGFLIVPALARSVGERKLSELLHRQVSIGSIRFNPYSLSATVRDLRVRDHQGAPDLLTLKELYVDVQLASLWKRGLVVRQLRVVEPAICVARTAPNRYSFSDILDSFESPPSAPSPPSQPAGEPMRFSLSNLELVDGRVAFDDRPVARQHAITGLKISVPFISNFPYLVETFVQPAFAATINGTRLAVSGRTKPFADSLESSIDVNLNKVDLPFYLAYVPAKLRFALRSAVLDTDLKVTFIQYRDRAPRVDVSGSVALSALDAVDDRGKALLNLPLLDVAIGSSDLLSNQLVVERVLLKSLSAHLRRGKRGDMQLQHLVASGESSNPALSPAATAPTKMQAPPQSAPPNKPWLVQIADIRLDDARVVYTDEANPRPIQIALAPLDLRVRRFSTAKGTEAAVDLTALTDAKESIDIAGHLAIAPFAFRGTVTAKRLPPARYTPYYGAFLAFDLRQGTLDVAADVDLGEKQGQFGLVVKGARVDLHDLQLRRYGDAEDFLRMPELSVRDGRFDLRKGDLALGEVIIAGTRVRLERSGGDKPWNLETLLANTPPERSPPTHQTAPPAIVPAEPNPPAERPFRFAVDRLDLKGWTVRIEDRAPRTPAVIALDRVGLRLDGFSTERGRQGRITLQARLNQGGTVGVTGSIGLAPSQANLQVQLKSIPILPFQPYFEDSVALLVASGHVGVDGRVVLATGPRGPAVSYTGEASLGNLVAMDRGGAEELLRFGTLRASGIDLTVEPFKLNVTEIALTDYAANLVVKPDHTVNFASLAGGTSKPASPAAGPAATTTAPPAVVAPSPAVQIGAVVLRGGTINVTDRSIQPAFGTSLTSFGGRVANLSFNESERAEVAINGRLGGGPLEITGQINPLAKRKHIDLMIKLSDLDLSAMSPYSGKYAGYAVEKGQLALDLSYLIDASKLDAQNRVRIDQLTFGHAVESKNATNLPVRLAVSLLKDRQGVIRVDLPVSGSLDDPKFSVWGVVWTVLKNLLIKAATSPFALLGSLFGGGEELSWIDFEPGRADLTATSRTKLETLGKALQERPALQLEVEGHAEVDRDSQALRRLELERRVKAQKLKEMVSTGSSASAEVTLSPAEYPKYLKLAYNEAKIDKPKNFLGIAKDIAVSEMERLMLVGMTVSESDLRLLARQRAQIAREQILRGRQIGTERVFLVEPKSLRPEHDQKTRNSRVDFRLK